MFGYDTGVVSGAMIKVDDKFHLSEFYHELVVAVAIGAAAVAAAIAGNSSGPVVSSGLPLCSDGTV